MSNKQEEVFGTSEGDHWYQRNAKAMDTKQAEADKVIQLLDFVGHQPKSVLEVGCADGYRLEFFRERYGSTAAGIEISPEAIEAGKQKYPEIDLSVGSASDLSAYETGAFDCVIMYGVFVWIDRSLLLKVCAELDRVLADGGIIIISDFYPDTPRKVDYHHVDDEVWTYKQDYAAIFSATNLYTEEAHLNFSLATKEVGVGIEYRDRYCIKALRKDLDGRYMA